MLFGYGADKRVIYGLLIILALYTLIGMTSAEWFSILITFPAVVIAVSFHEFAHAYTADRFGDTTPRSQGRLTLNPKAHLDFFGCILMMFAHIGWGKPVQINPNNFNSNKSRGYCEAMVSLAGPLMNFIIAIISSIIYILLYGKFTPSFTTTEAGVMLGLFLTILITVNIGLGVFNLIPLPPLDGEKIFRNVLPYKAKEWLDRNYYTLYYIFMILWFFGYLGVIVQPVISFISNGLFYILGTIINFIF